MQQRQRISTSSVVTTATFISCSPPNKLSHVVGPEDLHRDLVEMNVPRRVLFHPDIHALAAREDLGRDGVRCKYNSQLFFTKHHLALPATSPTLLSLIQKLIPPLYVT